jgi:hypothetical protein
LHNGCWTQAPSLYSRIQTHGTLTERPQDVPDARFALPSAIHWMRALAILVADQHLDFAAGRKFYGKVQARNLPDRELNTVCEQLLFVLNQIAALRALTLAANKADVARTAIVAWYYGVYSAASAMTAAMDGSFQDSHADTAAKWQERFPAKNKAMHPFADCLSSVVPATVDAELAPVRLRGQFSLVKQPTTAQDAWGCRAEYLSGTAGWERWNVEERVRTTAPFKDLKVNDSGRRPHGNCAMLRISIFQTVFGMPHAFAMTRHASLKLWRSGHGRSFDCLATGPCFTSILRKHSTTSSQESTS